MPGTTNAQPFRIHKLNRQHDRMGFSCGIVSLDEYLQKRANQDARNRVAAPFVLTAGDAPAVIGYYTLSAVSVVLTDLPTSTTRKLPRYPIVPATLLGRLALDSNYHNRSLGEYLLMDALYRAFANSKQIASFAVVVDAINEVAENFYINYEFQRFPEESSRLFLPMKKIERLFQA